MDQSVKEVSKDVYRLRFMGNEHVAVDFLSKTSAAFESLCENAFYKMISCVGVKAEKQGMGSTGEHTVTTAR